ncbi:MAG TPA: hypothetical protein VMQ76_09595 [Terracidiphilus sp.]|nr:hypothetical protein [Terracidiphilus sp.]
MKKIQYRQGDVFLERIGDYKAAPAAQAEAAQDGRVILAHGEVTGHHHSVAESDAELVKEGERMLLHVERQTALEHQEHGAIVLEPGVYEVRRQREYSPEAIRNVAD